jgi:hypothetical protein
MRITEMLSELENREQERMDAVEGLSPLTRGQTQDPEMRSIIARLKRPRPTRILRQMLAADPETRPLLKNLSLGYSEES